MQQKDNQEATFSQRVMALAQEPLNMGRLEGAHGEGFKGSDCGDWVKMWVKLDEQGRIAEAKWQAYGCASALASSSVLSEMAKGKTLEAALNISPEDVIAMLGGLPEHKTHCSGLSYGAFTAAIQACRGS
jgi:NifU-like protein